MHRTLWSLVLIGVLLFVATSATAAPPARGGPHRGRPHAARKPAAQPKVNPAVWRLWMALDTNKDGKIDKAEFAKAAPRVVAALRRTPTAKAPAAKAPAVKRPQVGVRGRRGRHGPVARRGRGRSPLAALMARRRGMGGRSHGRRRGLAGRRPMLGGRFGGRRPSFGRGSQGRGWSAGRSAWGRCPMRSRSRSTGRWGSSRRGGFSRGGSHGILGRLLMWRTMLAARRGWGSDRKRPSFGHHRGTPSAQGKRPSFGWGSRFRGRSHGPARKPEGKQHDVKKPDVRSRLKSWHDRLSDEQKEKMKGWVEAMKKRAEAWRRGHQKPQTPKKPVVKKPARRKPVRRKPAPRKPAPKKPEPQKPSMHRPGGDQRRGPGRGNPAMGRLFHFMRTKDKNQDRKLDVKEFGDAKKFKELDKDKDGFLSLRELFGALGGRRR